MKNKILLYLGIIALITASCVDDDYTYDREEPNWLGTSIYDYLKTDGNYTIFIKLIEECDYMDVLQRTGSKTLFAADDEAFNRFFTSSNVYGVKSYEQLTLAQKKSIMNYALIDNAYLIETFCTSALSSSDPIGKTYRQPTSYSVVDSIPFRAGDNLPENSYWSRFKDKGGIHLLEDDANKGVVFFFQQNVNRLEFTNQDLHYLLNGAGFSTGDAYIFDIKVKNDVYEGGKLIKRQRDITCKNGYIHLMTEVLVPHDNMAQFINKNREITTFRDMMDRFSAPYYYSGTLDYQVANPSFTDSIFVKRYFTSSRNSDPSGTVVNDLLLFDPGNNALNSLNKSYGEDIPVMFVPTNEAINKYFDEGDGYFLKEAYHTWGNVPNNVISSFVSNHMKYSLLEAMPSKFSDLNDEKGYKMDISPNDIKETYIGVNGVVYITNKVYPPAEYSSVLSPILVNDNMKIFNWAVKQLQYDLYLTAMEDNITFSFFIPTDNILINYIDPVAQGYTVPQRWKFWYDNVRNQTVATAYNLATGDSIGIITSTTVLLNRLKDILDSHIVVDNVESGNKFYMTKGYGELKIDGNGIGMKVYGGGQLERGEASTVTKVYTNKNGKTYIIDKQIQDPFKSVYKTLEAHPEFSEFFKMCSEAELYGYPIFTKNVKYTPLYSDDYNVKSFNTYHYTLYVPTNDKMRKAVTDGLIPSWDDVAAQTDASKRKEMAEKIQRFLNYHFQDNSVYIGGPSINAKYQTATLNKSTQKFYTVNVRNTSSNLVLTSLVGDEVHVITSGGLYNLMCRDYMLNSPANSTATQIETSSRCVIHQIDNILRFE